ncbi:MAG: sugar phosphate isomerase/epimerase [Anaerolineae bacterium]|nr:sugar phosphate isomerase/epimerase [Anaerolineae bacterium]
MDIGMSLFDLNYEQLGRALSIIADSGVRAIEVSFIPFTATDEQLRHLSRRYANAGAPWRSIHAQFGEDGDLGSTIESLRRHGVEVHKDLIRRAHVVDAPYIVVHPGRGVRDLTRIPAQEVSTRRSLEELVPLAEEAGVVLALENMLPHHSYEQSERMRALVEEFDSPALRTCFDSGHAHVGEGVPHVVQALGETIVTVHLADNDTSGDLHLQPPYGTINWAQVFRGLADAGFQGPMTVETRPWGASRPSRLVLELQALHHTSTGIEGALPQIRRDNGTGAWLRCPLCGHYTVETREGLSCACGEDKLDYRQI